MRGNIIHIVKFFLNNEPLFLSPIIVGIALIASGQYLNKRKSTLTFDSNSLNIIEDIIIVVLLLLPVSMFYRPAIEGDTVALYQSVTILKSSLMAGHLTGVVQQFPLASHIIMLIFSSVFPAQNDCLLMFSYLSFISYVLIAVVGYIFIRSRLSRIWSIVAVQSLLYSYLIYYSESSFYELFPAVLLLLFSIGILSRYKITFIAILGIIVGLSREVYLPFVVLIWLILNKSLGYPLIVTKRNIYLFTIFLVTIVSTLLFNVYRYQSVLNGLYMNPKYLDAVSLSDFLSYFSSQFFSPNGGVFIFAFSMTIGLVILAILVFTFPRGGKNRILGLLFLSNILFMMFIASRTLAPFGWVCWGERYLVVFLPTTFLITLYFWRDTAKYVEHKLSSTFFRAIVSAIFIFFILASLPNYRVFLDRNPALTYMFGTPTKSHPTGARMDIDIEYYKSWISELMWERKSAYLLEFKRELTSNEIWPVGMYIICSMTLVLLLLKSRRRQDYFDEDETRNLV